MLAAMAAAVSAQDAFSVAKVIIFFQLTQILVSQILCFSVVVTKCNLSLNCAGNLLCFVGFSCKIVAFYKVFIKKV